MEYVVFIASCILLVVVVGVIIYFIGRLYEHIALDKIDTELNEFTKDLSFYLRVDGRGEGVVHQDATELLDQIVDLMVDCADNGGTLFNITVVSDVPIDEDEDIDF